MSVRARAGLLAALCAALVAASLGLAACGEEETGGPGEATTVTTATGVTSAPTAQLPPAPPDPPPPVRGPYEPGGLPRIASQLTAQLGQRPMVLEISMSANFVSFEVQDPDRPDQVNEFEWRDGVIEGPTPVRFSGSRGTVAEVAFPLASVNLNAAVRLVRAAREQPIEGAEIGSMIIRRQLPFSRGVIWFVNVNGTRDNRQLRARADGTIFQVV